MSSESRAGLESSSVTRMRASRPRPGFSLRLTSPWWTEDAVFVDEGHDVGNGSHGSESDGGDEKVSHPWVHSFGSGGLLAQCPGEFEGDARSAEAWQMDSLVRADRGARWLGRWAIVRQV